MNDFDPQLLFETTERVFATHGPVTPGAAAQESAVSVALWQQLEVLGLLAMLAPESRGGIGATAGSFVGVLRIAGRHAAPGPVVESMVARWLAAQLGVDTGESQVGMASSGWSTQGDALHGQVRSGPHPATELTLVIDPLESTWVGLLAAQGCSATPWVNLAGEPMRELRTSRTVMLASARRCPLALALQAAELLSLGRAALIVGALERTMELTLDYARQRTQFGRPIGEFQAVQQLLASLAGAVAAASAITAAAARGVEAGTGGALLEAARIRLADAVDTVTAHAHQIHGAMGITREYALQRYTRRLWAWRSEAAPLAATRQRLASRLLGCGADELWPRIVTLGSGA